MDGERYRSGDSGPRVPSVTADGDAQVESYQGLLASLPDGIIVIDADGAVALINSAAAELFRSGGDSDLIGHQLGLPLADESSTAEIELPDAHGSYRVVRLRMRPISWLGQPATLCVTEDITTSATELSDLRDSEARYALAVRGSNDGLWDWDMEAGTLHVSERWRELLGLDHLPEDDNDPSLWLDRTLDADKSALLDALDAHLLGREPLFEVQHRLQHRDGSYRWMLARGRAVFDEAGEPVRLAGSITDIGQRKDLEERLRHEARHDPLTGLANRRLFLEHAETVIARSSRSHVAFAIALLDLDGFKEINDTHGHDRGDEILIEVGRRISDTIRPSDLAARLGGDEFAVVFDDVGTPQAATTIVKRLQSALAQPIGDLTAGASIGVCVHQGRAAVSTLLQRADASMYEAKQTGEPVLTTLGD